MLIIVVAGIACLLAVIPALMFRQNLCASTPPPWPEPEGVELAAR